MPSPLALSMNIMAEVYFGKALCCVEQGALRMHMDYPAFLCGHVKRDGCPPEQLYSAACQMSCCTLNAASPVRVP